MRARFAALAGALLVALLAAGARAGAGTPQYVAVVAGLNNVDPGSYAGWDGHLNAALNDANDMAALLGKQRFTVTSLLGPDASRGNVLGEIRKARELGPGSMLVVFFSGHGARVPDSSEPNGAGSAWCLYDGELLGRDLGVEWTMVPAGVRIVVVLDSCFSGGGITVAPTGKPIKEIPPDVQARVLQGAAWAKGIVSFQTPTANPPATKAAVILLSACGASETTAEGLRNGVFTEKLLEVWNNGAFPGTYQVFREEIQRALRNGRPPWTQSPVLVPVGSAGGSLKGARPFTP